MRGDFHDRLIDQLLREILGGDRPRDMTERVVAQAKILDRFRRRMWWGAGSAMAAAAAIVVSVILLWPHETAYPAPSVDTEVATVNDTPVDRGSTFYTGDNPGVMTLGGYVQVKMDPATQLNWAGSKYQEKVSLNQGALDVDVTKHKGQFDIAVGPATVHVTGTKFRVRVGQEETPTTWMRKLYLAVKEGSVEVQNLPDASGAQTVTAGQERDFVLAMRPKATNGGGIGFAQRAAQLGARGGPVSALLPGAGGLGALRSAATATAPHTTTAIAPHATAATYSPSAVENGVVRLTTTPGSALRVGRLQMTGSIYYLQSGDINYFLFERSSVAGAHPEWLTYAANQYMHATWREGSVVDLAKYVPTSSTTTQTK